MAIGPEEGRRVLEELGNRTDGSAMKTGSGWELSYAYGRSDDLDLPRMD